MYLETVSVHDDIHDSGDRNRHNTCSKPAGTLDEQAVLSAARDATLVSIMFPDRIRRWTMTAELRVMQI